MSQRNSVPSPPASRSMTLPMRTFTTPRKPWSFFLNFFWSNICTARMLSSFTRLSSDQHLPECPLFRSGIHVEAFVPIWVQCLLDNDCCLRLLPVDGRNSERVGKPCSVRRQPILLHDACSSRCLLEQSGRRTEDISLV